MKCFISIIFIFFTLLVAEAQPFTNNIQISSSLTDLQRGEAEWCDYDLDGDLDVFITGNNSGNPYSAMYKNSNGEFSQLEFVFPGLEKSQVSWNDFNLDGSPDLYLSGMNMAGEPIGILFENSGNDEFEEVFASLPGSFDGASAWSDLDNDGDQDLVSIGNSGGEGATHIFRNDGGGQFTEIIHDLHHIHNGDLDIADFDQDMDQDILMVGQYKDSQGNEQKVLRIYVNTGEFQFAELSSGFVGMSESNCCWGDYDGDGDLDILVNGSTDAPTHLVYIYQNQGNDFFLNIGIEIFGTVNGSIEWGDYDNDGDLDFLLTGMPSYGGEPITEIYRNVSENLFTKAEENFPNVYHSDGKWGDYDGDGDLDLIIMGYQTEGTNITAVFSNDNSEVNEPPDIPDELISDVNGNEVILHWSPSSDPETKDSSLTYNLRVGTLTGFNSIMSSMATENGDRLVVAAGNVAQQLEWKLKGLASGEYMWNVQALDNHFEASSFSSSGFFTVDEVSVQEPNSNPEQAFVIAYPIPFSYQLSLYFPEGLLESTGARWYTIDGEIVIDNYTLYANSQFNNISQNNRLVIQPNLEKGVYFLEIFSITTRKRLALLKVLKRE